MRFVVESGRRVGVHLTTTRAAWGEDELVVFCHPAPGAGAFDPDPEETRSRRLTLLSVDRPGYGRSDAVRVGEWATVASAARDLASVLDGLRAERVGVVGWSAGGRVALALAALRPDLVDRVAVVATPAPDEEVPWIDPDQRSALARLAALRPEQAHDELARRLASLVPTDPFSGEALWLLAAVTSDEPALSDAVARDQIGRMLRAAFAQGAGGLAADIAGYCLRPWGFAPEAVHAETLLVYGSHDPLATPEHGRWWDSRLPSAELQIVPETGHLVLLPAWRSVLAHVAPRADVRQLPTARATPEREEVPAA